jgi:hypothetical protein
MLALAAVSGVATQLFADSAREIELAEGLIVALLVASWCHHDARERGDTLSRRLFLGIFLLALIFLPVYFFRTRGIRGLVSILLALAFYIAMIGVQMLTMVVASYMV